MTTLYSSSGKGLTLHRRGKVRDVYAAGRPLASFDKQYVRD